MLNILGDIWFIGDGEQLREPAWEQLLALRAPACTVRKRTPTRSQDGHISFIAPTLAQAQQQLAVACGILGIPL